MISRDQAIVRLKQLIEKFDRLLDQHEHIGMSYPDGYGTARSLLVAAQSIASHLQLQSQIQHFEPDLATELKLFWQGRLWKIFWRKSSLG
jgi:hypothetical protein